MAELNNTKLLEAISVMKESKTPESQQAVLEEIVMNAQFMIPAEVSKISEEEAKTLPNPQHNTRIKFAMITNDKRQTFFPAFTSIDELHKWNKEYKGHTINLSFDDYALMISKEERIGGMVVDPFSSNLVIDRRMAEDLKIRKEVRLKGSAERVLKSGTKVKLGVPKEYPNELIDAIKEYMKTKEEINAAYFRLMLKEDGAASYLIAVDFDGDKDELFSGIADAARPHLGNMFIDLISVEVGLGKSVSENTEPFYTKD